ncbi:MAG: carbohydrate binding domain-containing protein [Fibrobacterota bacterium]
MKRITMFPVIAALLLQNVSAVTLEPMDIEERRIGPFTVKPVQSVVDSIANYREQFVSDEDTTIAYKFFEEDYAAGGYDYKYPDASKVYIPEESGKSGQVSVCFDLDPNSYSGGAIVLHGTEMDLSDIVYEGALEFWVKGSTGGEKCNIALADSEADGVKTENVVSLENYASIKPFWTKVSIPLADFGRRGVYWDAKKQTEVPHSFDWSTVKEFLVVIEKGKNPDFKVWMDNIYIKKDVYDSSKTFDKPYWDERELIVDNYDTSEQDISANTILLDGTLSEEMYGHKYGGKTVYAPKPTDEPDVNDSVMVLYFDNSTYAGINFNLGKTYDLDSLRENGAGIGFWAKAGNGMDKVLTGLVDSDEGDGKAVETYANLSDFGDLDTTWDYFMIPLREFSEDGTWWNEEIAGSSVGTMDFSSIVELAFSTDKYRNRVGPNDPAILMIDNVGLIDSVPGYVDPEKYWDSFTSDAPDRLIFDFEDLKGEWSAYAGSKSSISANVDFQTDKALRDTYGKKYLKIKYSLSDWAECSYDFISRNAADSLYDWSKHRAIRFDVKSDLDEEMVGVKIKDAGGEAWVTNVKITRGWNTVTVPFRKLRKDASYQESGAVVDGKLDLSEVQSMILVPKEIGMSSTLIIDNVTITNTVE